ncbi:hypothetical protein GCM10023195_85190 [Actinoallomurus liliacearum]|uniref:Uncharacterized protein n=1 Tax=Actinoallomurus liliacearum TaxID=1080073 RepID=A0ABP8TY26_9ACTN
MHGIRSHAEKWTTRQQLHDAVEKVNIQQARNSLDHDLLVYVAIAIDAEGDVLESADRYYYECETPSDADELGYTVARSGDHVSYEEMLRAAAAHLRTRQA